MKPEFKPTAMPCTKEDFEKIRPLLKKHNVYIELTLDFASYVYLVNNICGTEAYVGTVYSNRRRSFDRTIYHEWDETTFLRNCGINVTPIEHDILLFNNFVV